MKSVLSALFISTILLAGNASASEDRPDHFKGKPSTTLQEAVTNLNEYNQKLQALLNAELTPAAMAEIHQLTYTLEQALQKVHQETEKMQQVLEEVHVASEHMDVDTAKTQGKIYLQNANTLLN